MVWYAKKAYFHGLKSSESAAYSQMHPSAVGRFVYNSQKLKK
jgi:hypothetical protein